MQKRDKLGVIYSHEETGLCRLYYRPADRKDKRLFCTQGIHPDSLSWYICSRDGEPSHEVTELEIVEVIR